jgi:hypothetical protein
MPKRAAHPAKKVRREIIESPPLPDAAEDW